MNCQAQNNGQTCGRGPSCRPGIQNRLASSSSAQMQSYRSGSTYGGGYATNRQRAPAVFPSSSSGNFYSAQNPGQQQQQSSRGCTTARPMPMQNIGRSNQYKMASNSNNYQSPYKQVQQQQPSPVSAPQGQQSGGPQYCTPQAIKINVTADQLQNAKNAPIYQDRGDPCVSQEQGGNGVKYIQLNWQDLLGGMENLRVSMAPSSDNCNPNRQLKVSFGGQKTDPPQAGETPLKVISIQPASTTERMEVKQGNAYAGAMKVCNPPTNMRMSPATASPPQYSGGNYGQTGGASRGNCRR